jgi:hypothetical protein
METANSVPRAPETRAHSRADTPADADTPPAAHGAVGTGEAAVADSGDGVNLEGPAAAVWGALADRSGGTVPEIALAAGVSKSAARKALILLEGDGLVNRTAGGSSGGKRAPDTWRPVPQSATPDADVPATNAAPPAETDGEPGSAGPAPGSPEASAEPEASADQETPADEVAAEQAGGVQESSAEQANEDQEPADDAMDAAAVAEAREALAELRDEVEAALAAMDAGDRDTARAKAEAVFNGSGKVRRLVRTAVNGRRRTASGRARSQPGELRTKVAAHLAAHPGKEFTPHEIGKVLGHSAGAVAVAMDRLIALEQAVQTCERPRRFAAAPAAS